MTERAGATASSPICRLCGNGLTFNRCPIHGNMDCPAISGQPNTTEATLSAESLRGYAASIGEQDLSDALHWAADALDAKDAEFAEEREAWCAENAEAVAMGKRLHEQQREIERLTAAIERVKEACKPNGCVTGKIYAIITCDETCKDETV